MAHAREVDGDVILDLETEELTLTDVKLGALHADDFIFAGAPSIEQQIVAWASDPYVL